MEVIMDRFLRWMEKMLMAITFAEAGEAETAMRLAPVKQFEGMQVKMLLDDLNCYFSAVAFAEANCHQWANPERYTKRKSRRPVRLSTFLQDIGLQNVRVQYGIALV
jgi:hypothetical protein